MAGKTRDQHLGNGEFLGHQKNMHGTRAAETERTAVPEAVATNQPTATPTRSDPLIDAGVVPDLPANPAPEAPAGGEAPILPEQGGGDDIPPQ